MVAGVDPARCDVEADPASGSPGFGLHCGAMPLVPKARLGNYEILGSLGAGGMGEVYRARDLRLGRDVAVKVLPADVASSAERLARFEREARTAAGLNHPNIVTLYSVEDQDGVRFLTMELIEGQTLSTLITPGGFALSRILELAIPLIDALVTAHERGVIHRDLKPGNVMVTHDGRVKVLDFGLAKLTRIETDSKPQGLTMTSPISDARIVGTLPYSAPEQLRGEDTDARSDLFSLGVLLYELAAGKRPFEGETSADVTSAILRDSPPPLTTLRPDLPADLDRIIGRCLEKPPRARFQTALDVANELRAVRRTLEHGTRQAAQPAPEGIASIAVLPFVNRSASSDDEYFSDGLADELLNVLAKIRGLRVAARTSAFHFKGKDATIAEIGQALHVATVLEGSVRKAGPRVRISVQLVKVSDGYHLWSETYDRTLDDIFAVQDDIAQSVVKELRATLLGEALDSKATGEVKAEVSKASRGRGTNPEAHRLYLQARHLIGRYTRADIAKSIEYLKEALELEPEFAQAWATLAWAYAKEADYGWVPLAEGNARAHEAVGRALELEPDLAEGHATLAWIQMIHDWNWRGAEASFRRALELAPGDASVLRRAGVLASNQGRLADALAFYRRALEQDPLDAHCYNNLGIELHADHREVEAEAAYRKALELAPQRINTHGLLALTLLAQGRVEDALAEAAQEPDDAMRLWSLAIVQHASGHGAESDHTLRELIDTFADVSPYSIAEVYALRGGTDAAFAWLERAYTQRDTGLSSIKVSPGLRPLHRDPRWGPFVTKMGFEE